MVVLVICRPAEGADQAEFLRLVPAEAVPAEAPGLIAGLPLVQAGLISTETILLHPLDL